MKRRSPKQPKQSKHRKPLPRSKRIIRYYNTRTKKFVKASNLKRYKKSNIKRRFYSVRKHTAVAPKAVSRLTGKKYSGNYVKGTDYEFRQSDSIPAIFKAVGKKHIKEKRIQHTYVRIYATFKYDDGRKPEKKDFSTQSWEIQSAYEQPQSTLELDYYKLLDFIKDLAEGYNAEEIKITKRIIAIRKPKKR